MAVPLRLRVRELEGRLRELEWTVLRHVGGHDVWTDGDRLEYLPRRETRPSSSASSSTAEKRRSRIDPRIEKPFDHRALGRR
jgi:hypothetical protein